MSELAARLLRLVRDVPDYPQPGIVFKDITPLLGDHDMFAATVRELAALGDVRRVDKVVGIEARGFILAAPVALDLKAGFVPVRKPGKLPADSFEVKYNLEYGSNSLAIHRDAVQMGERILVVDDLLATGGTAAATVHLLRQLGAEIVALVFLVELTSLKGREKLDGFEIHSLITYS